MYISSLYIIIVFHNNSVLHSHQFISALLFYDFLFEMSEILINYKISTSNGFKIFALYFMYSPFFSIEQFPTQNLSKQMRHIV